MLGNTFSYNDQKTLDTALCEAVGSVQYGRRLGEDTVLTIPDLDTSYPEFHFPDGPHTLPMGVSNQQNVGTKESGTNNCHYGTLIYF